MNINGAGCSSTYLNVHGVEYSRVCGKIIGYQQKTPDAFWAYYNNHALTINQTYVDGISLTHGHKPRNHIWTFTAALDETLVHPYTLCPCTNIHNRQKPYQSLLMLAVTTFVTQQVLKITNIAFTPTILSGMARAVVHLTLAVPSTTLHGS